MNFMKGLRERNRVDRHGRILDAATRQFREGGYEETRIEAIAAEAGVAIGTIYNYFQNKGDILVAIVAKEVNEVLKAGEGIVASPPLDVTRAVNALIAAYIGHSLSYLSKAMWRQAMATSTMQPESPFGLTYAALDRGLANQTCRLIEALRALGRVKPEVDCRAIGEMLFNNTNMMFIEFVKTEDMPTAKLLRAIRRQNRAVLKLISAEGGA